jgi:hypothetical protein
MSDEPQYCALAGLIHLVGIAEQTLCGMALEGAEFGGPAMAVVAQRIRCDQCISLIEYVKSVPNSLHRDRKRLQRTNRLDR